MDANGGLTADRITVSKQISVAEGLTVEGGLTANRLLVSKQISVAEGLKVAGV